MESEDNTFFLQGSYYFKDFPVNSDLLPKFLRIFQGFGFVTFRNIMKVKKEYIEFNRAEYVIELT